MIDSENYIVSTYKVHLSSLNHIYNLQLDIQIVGNVNLSINH